MQKENAEWHPRIYSESSVSKTTREIWTTQDTNLGHHDHKNANKLLTKNHRHLITLISSPNHLYTPPNFTTLLQTHQERRFHRWIGDWQISRANYCILLRKSDQKPFCDQSEKLLRKQHHHLKGYILVHISSTTYYLTLDIQI